MHAVMKYRLGFLSREEVLDELEEIGHALASERGDRAESMCQAWSELVSDIKGGTFQ